MVYAKAVLKCLTTGQFLDRALGIHALLNKDHDSPRVLTGSHRVSLCLLIWGGGWGGGGGLGQPSSGIAQPIPNCVWLQ